MTKIETFFKDNLEAKTVLPSQNMWQKISQTPELIRFNKKQRIKRLAPYGIGSIVVAVLVSTLLWFNWSAKDKKTSSQAQPLIINQNITSTVSLSSISIMTSEEKITTTDTSKEKIRSTTPVAQSSTLPVHTPSAHSMPTISKETLPDRPTNSACVMAERDDNSKSTVHKPTTEHNKDSLAFVRNSSLPSTEANNEEEEPLTETYELFMPNAFSPNGDGINDRYELSAAFEINNFNLYIYDRSGQLVFKSTDITHAWTGEMNGKVLPAGTYTYWLKYMDELNLVHQKKGYILLIR